MIKYCTLTGVQCDHLPWMTNHAAPECVDLNIRLNQAVEDAVLAGYTDFFCGLDGGIGRYFATQVLNLRRIYPHIRLIGVPAELDFYKNEYPRDQFVLYNIMNQCDYCGTVRCESTDAGERVRKGSRWMVDQSEGVIIVNDGVEAEVRHILMYAGLRGRRIMQIPLYKDSENKMRRPAEMLF